MTGLNIQHNKMKSVVDNINTPEALIIYHKSWQAIAHKRESSTDIFGASSTVEYILPSKSTNSDNLIAYDSRTHNSVGAEQEIESRVRQLINAITKRVMDKNIEATRARNTCQDNCEHNDTKQDIDE